MKGNILPNVFPEFLNVFEVLTPKIKIRNRFAHTKLFLRTLNEHIWNYTTGTGSLPVKKTQKKQCKNKRVRVMNNDDNVMFFSI